MQHLQPNTTLQGGKYRIERVLGQGGFGITYLAVQTSLNRFVAIKELFIGGSGQAINDRRGNQVVVTNSANQQSFNQQKAKFKKEALRLANLNHPNLVKVHEFFEENGTAYYVMDYIEGESLRTKLNREGVLSEDLVLKYLQQLLHALETAHKQNIWHLDIKPENIMVDRYGHVYLIDFGASKHIEQNSTLTTSLALAYTKGYCPPELADLTYESDLVQALKEIGPWTDIYALGATIYNLLTDSIPPSSNRLYKMGRNAFSFPINISSSTQDLIVWMMKPDKEERPQKIREITIIFSSANEDSEETKLDKIKSFLSEVHLDFIVEHDIKAVDLGLSVLWANSNLGGTIDKPRGELYEWSDTYEIIRNQLGCNWRLPNRKDWEELVSKCIWKYEGYEHENLHICVEGYRVEGPNGNSIFMPIVGVSSGNGICFSSGCYWINNKDNFQSAYYFRIEKGDIKGNIVSTKIDNNLRLAVRPIYDR